MSKIETHTKVLEKDHEKLAKFSDNMMESVSKVLDAQDAWQEIKNTSHKIGMSASILRYIQKTGFSMGCREQTDNRTGLKIVKPNIIVKTFTMDYKNGVDFEVSGKDSSISVPAGMPEPKLEDKCRKGTAVGSMFDKLSRYLSDHLDKNHEINSNIVAFSIQDNDSSTQLPDNSSPIRIV